MISNKLISIVFILIAGLVSINSIAQPPANDDCSGATTIAPASFSSTCSTIITGNTLNATKSTPNPSCTSSFNDDDIWYQFRATTKSVVLRVFNAVNNASGKSTSIGFSLYEGNCPANMNSLICTNIINAGNGLLIISDLVPGTNYYGRFWTSSTGTSASFDFCVQEAAPPGNDDWQDAIHAGMEPRGTICDNLIEATTVGATRSFPDAECTSGNDDDIWYSFQAVSNGALLNFSNATIATSISGSANLGYAVYKSTDFPATESINCNANIGISSGSTLIGGLEPGEMYLLRLFSYNTNNYIRFSFCLVDQPIVENDECNSAIDIPVTPGFCVHPVSGDLTNATTSLEFGSPACTALSSSEDVWFKAVVPASGNLKVQTFAVNKRINDLVMEVYSGTCGNLQLIGCYDDDDFLPPPSKGHPSAEFKNRAAGEILYFRILGKGSINNGPFVIGAWDPSIVSEISAGGVCIPIEKITIDSVHQNRYRWVPVFDSDENIVAEIYADGSEPGEITGSLFVNNNVVRNYEGTYYLDRNLTIQGSKNTSSTIRIYFTEEELAKLKNVDPAIISEDQLSVTRNESTCGNFLTVTGTNILADTNAKYGMDHYLQFSTPSFSSFYISRRVDALPLKFISFTGNQNSGGINLTWKVVRDETIKGFRVEQSENGFDFKEIGFVNKTEKSGESVGIWGYEFHDHRIISGIQFYRITLISWQGGELYSEILPLKKEVRKKSFGIYPNPFQDHFYIEANGSQEPIKWSIMDAQGRIVRESGRIYLIEKRLLVDVKLPPGLYFIRIIDFASDEVYIDRLICR